MAEVVATAIVHCHLHTLDRLGIDYDLLTRESEILHLKFWDAAFEMLKERSAIQFATEGKNKGCWVMELPKERRRKRGTAKGAEDAEEKRRAGRGGRGQNHRSLERHRHLRGKRHRQPPLEIRPARRAISTTSRSTRIRTATKSGPPRASRAKIVARPEFGHAHEVFNVIDSRQAYPQQVVVAALRALGYTAEADNLKHFAYNVVALTPRCALEMGYDIPPEDAKRPYIEVSGRKGQGVKADDLLDQLEASARKEVDARHADSPEAEARRHRARHRHRRAALFSAALHAFHGDRLRFQGCAEL